MYYADAKISVVIPCFNVKDQIVGVVTEIPDFVSRIYVIDDCCPEQSVAFLQSACSDKRLEFVFHEKNKGVGGAMISGYSAALRDDMDIVVKVDGDGQMDPSLMPLFIEPIINGVADYTKGNRFFNLASLSQMPWLRIIGNAGLSLLTKVSSGYWDVVDPTNGYTAIHKDTLKELPLDKLDERYFFESDMLFRMNTLRAVVQDIPMDAKYADEKSNLQIKSVIFEFALKNMRNFAKRIFYNYFLRDFSFASIQLVLGSLLFCVGAVASWRVWAQAKTTGDQTPLGTVMICSLLLLVGFHLLMSFINFDINSSPKSARSRKP